MFKINRGMVFVDHQNFIIAVHNYYKGLGLYEPKINYDKMSRKIIEDLPVTISYTKTFIFAPRADDFLMQLPRWQNYQTLIDGIRSKNFLDIVESRMIARPRYSNIGWNEMDPNNIETYEEFEKGTDVNLAVNLVSKAFFNAFDTAIIISADSDYEDAFKILNTLGKSIVSIGVSGQNIRRISEFADYYLYLDDAFFQKCLQIKKTYFQSQNSVL